GSAFGPPDATRSSTIAVPPRLSRFETAWSALQPGFMPNDHRRLFGPVRERVDHGRLLLRPGLHAGPRSCWEFSGHRRRPRRPGFRLRPPTDPRVVVGQERGSLAG